MLEKNSWHKEFIFQIKMFVSLSMVACQRLGIVINDISITITKQPAVQTTI